MTILARKIRLIMKLRKSGITDTGVLGAIERVPREVFIPTYFHDQAYEDIALPIGRGQTISQPLVVASMTQELQVNDRHKVLEIGTGSGYQAAILAKLCRRVYSIERHRPLLALAESRLNELKIRNITCKAADGMKGWIEQAPFDRIIVTAAAGDEAPPALLAWAFGWKPALETSGRDWVLPLLTEALDDPYAAVRVIAHRSAKEVVGPSMVSASGYDFTASRADRLRAREALMDSWSRRSQRPIRGTSEPVLMDADGVLDTQTLRRLVEERNTRPVHLRE